MLCEKLLEELKLYDQLFKKREREELRWVLLLLCIDCSSDQLGS